MARLLFVVLILGLVTLPVYSYITLSSPPPVPHLDPNAWWGPSGLKDKQDTRILPFKVDFNEGMVSNLKDHLKRCHNFTPPMEGTSDEYGFNTNHLVNWCRYWANEYPFSEREKFFNRYPQFKINVQGLWIDFIWVKPKAAVRPELGTAEMSVVFRNLMNRLGYKNFVVQGGDLGSMIGSHLATEFPKEVLGYHTNMPFVLSPSAIINEVIGYLYPPLVVDWDQLDKDLDLSDRIDLLTTKFKTFVEKTGYLHIQATKPDTVGIALTDSPIGLLAYILEKFSSKRNPDNHQNADYALSFRWTKEQLIDNLMMYWTSKCITTAMRLYAETFNLKHQDLKLSEIPISVPTWVIQAKAEFILQPEYVFKYKYPNMLNATKLDYGSHFLAFELPKVFSEDVILAITQFKKLDKAHVKTDF